MDDVKLTEGTIVIRPEVSKTNRRLFPGKEIKVLTIWADVDYAINCKRLRHPSFMTGTMFDLIDSASDFGTIVESEQEVVFGELMDDEPVIPTVLSDSTNR